MLQKIAIIASFFVIAFGFQNCPKDNDFSEQDKASAASSEQPSQAGSCPGISMPTCNSNEELAIVYNSDDCAFALCRQTGNTPEPGVCGPVESANCQSPLVPTPSYDGQGCLIEVCAIAENPPTDNPNNPPIGGNPGTPGPPANPGGGSSQPDGPREASCTFSTQNNSVRVGGGQTVKSYMAIGGLSITRQSEGLFGHSGTYCYETAYSCDNSGNGSVERSYIQISTNPLYSSNFRNSYDESSCEALFREHSDFYSNWNSTYYESIRAGYQTHLGRDFDTVGLEYYFYQMKFRNLSLNAVLNTLRNSIEADLRDCYLDHLRREPRTEGMNYWRGQVEDGNVSRARACEIISESVEARIVDCYEPTSMPRNQWQAERYRDQVDAGSTTVAQVCTRIRNAAN